MKYVFNLIKIGTPTKSGFVYTRESIEEAVGEFLKENRGTPVRIGGIDHPECRLVGLDIDGDTLVGTVDAPDAWSYDSIRRCSFGVRGCGTIGEDGVVRDFRIMSVDAFRKPAAAGHLDVRELMIGDAVSADGSVAFVDSVKKDGTVFVDISGCSVSMSSRDIYGIEVTHFHMEDLGFEEVRDGVFRLPGHIFFYDINAGKVCTGSSFEECDTVVQMFDLKYLHQLQHFLSDTGHPVGAEVRRMLTGTPVSETCVSEGGGE